MISSVVARFEVASDKSLALQAMVAHPQIEIGDLIEGRSLPMTLEVDSSLELEQLHDWISALPGVAFVDVVFVCFETDPSNSNEVQT